MSSFKISRRSIEALRPERDGCATGRCITDSTLPGFFAAMYASGRISYGVRYIAAGRRRTVYVGTWPSTTPEDARRQALVIIGNAARGVDELATRQAAREEAQGLRNRITFETWRQQDVQDAARRIKAPKEVARYLGLPAAEWDRKALADLTVKDVTIFRDRLAARGSTQANRWLTTVRASFMRAARLGHLVVNPAALIQPLRENPPRTRVLAPDEERRLRAAVAAWPNVWEKCAWVLLLDTGARLSEVLAAKWSDFDLDAKDYSGTWRIPSPKAGTPQSQPILAHTGRVVLATPRVSDCAFLVPSRNALARRHDLRKSWDKLRAVAKIPADCHTHDLRRTAGLNAVLAVGLFGASKLLRHSNSAVTEKCYAPVSAEQTRLYAEAAEKGRKAKASGTLIAFRKKSAA